MTFKAVEIGMGPNTFQIIKIFFPTILFKTKEIFVSCKENERNISVSEHFPAWCPHCLG